MIPLRGENVRVGLEADGQMKGVCRNDDGHEDMRTWIFGCSEGNVGSQRSLPGQTAGVPRDGKSNGWDNEKRRGRKRLYTYIHYLPTYPAHLPASAVGTYGRMGVSIYCTTAGSLLRNHGFSSLHLQTQLESVGHTTSSMSQRKFNAVAMIHR